MGGSTPVHDFERKIVAHNGLIGDQVPIAAGISLTLPGEQVVCFLGDGAAEEDYVLGGLGWASTKNIPLLTIVGDNNLSILTEKKLRRNREKADVAKACQMKGFTV